MANPAEHSAREDARRSGTICGSDVDVTEHHLIAATAGEEDGGVGAWMLGEHGIGFERGVVLWGVADPL
jgi:hypothetical protein